MKKGKMKIRGRIVVSFIAANVIYTLCIAALMVFMHHSTQQYKDIYNNYGAPLATLGRAGTSFFNVQSELKSVLLSSDMEQMSAKMQEFGAAVTEVQGYLAQLDDELTEDDVVEKLNNAKTILFGLNDAYMPIVTLIQQGDVAGARAAFMASGLDEVSATITKGIGEMYDMLQKHADDEMTEIEDNLDLNTILIGVVDALVILGVSAIAVFLGHSIRGPLAKLRSVALKMAEGDVSANVEKVRNDEVGELADDLATMVENIRSQSAEMQKLAEGDLTVDYEPKSEADVMGNSIKKLVDMDNKTMRSIKTAVAEVNVGAGEVSSASQALAQGSTEQASAIQQITASIADITEKTKVNANDANEANDLVIKAKKDAEQGNIRMKDMISAMSDINDSSENISKIIKVIDDIAFQTNILALNAAVEAARAGQHGKGFAVVADEVRNLAGKSAQAASETAELIQDSIGKVEKGSKLAKETADALEGIVSAIDRIVALTQSIATASNDQATAISQIDLAIGQVSQVVQNNSATSEQCAAASEELATQAEKLKGLIGHYRLKEAAEERYKPLNFDMEASVAPQAMPSMIDLGDEPPKEDVPVISLDDDFGKY